MLFCLIRPFHQNFLDKLVINEYIQKASFKTTNRGRLVSNTFITHSSPQAQLIELQNDVKEKFSAAIILRGVYDSLERNLGSTRIIARAPIVLQNTAVLTRHLPLPPPQLLIQVSIHRGSQRAGWAGPRKEAQIIIIM